MAFSNDGDYFATAGGDKLIFVWKSNFYERDGESGTIIKPSPMGRNDVVEESGCLQGIEEVKTEEDLVITPVERRENQLKEFLSGHLEKIVFQLGQVTENLQRLDQKLTKNEEMVQSLMNDERVLPLLVENEVKEQKKEWESMKGEIEGKRSAIERNLQNIFSVGALATTGMLNEQINIESKG